MFIDIDLSVQDYWIAKCKCCVRVDFPFKGTIRRHPTLSPGSKYTIGQIGCVAEHFNVYGNQSVKLPFHN